MRHYLGACALAAAFLFAAPAAAQNPSSNSDDEIVVQGERERDRRIQEFIGALTDVPVNGQISRMEWAACPAAVGLSPAQNQAIAARMREVAAAAGMEVGAADCRPNALVIVTRDKQDLIEQLARRYPAYFSDMWPRQVRRLARAGGPASAWHVKGMIGPDGDEVAVDPTTGVATIDSSVSPSRIRQATRPHSAAAILVVEVGALGGLTTTQLADYAAMRTFAETEPAQVAGMSVPTILTVLDAPMGSEVPVTLTNWDLGFLRALYASPLNHLATAQRNEMRNHLRADLERAQEPLPE